MREEPSAVKPLSDTDQATVDRILLAAAEFGSLVEFVFRPSEPSLTFLVTPDSPYDVASLIVAIQDACRYPVRIAVLPVEAVETTNQRFTVTLIPA